MRTTSLTQNLLQLRETAVQEGTPNHVLAAIDSLSAQAKTQEKTLLTHSLDLENLKADNTLLKKKSRNLAKTLARKEEECAGLQEELKMVNCLLRQKTNKLHTLPDSQTHPHPHSSNNHWRPSVQTQAQGTQC
jgi:chromosome segregation ATPase